MTNSQETTLNKNLVDYYEVPFNQTVENIQMLTNFTTSNLKGYKIRFALK